MPPTPRFPPPLAFLRSPPQSWGRGRLFGQGRAVPAGFVCAAELGTAGRCRNKPSSPPAAPAAKNSLPPQGRVPWGRGKGFWDWDLPRQPPGAARSCCLRGQRGGGDGVGARGVDARPQFFDDLGQKCVRALGTRRNRSFLLCCPRLTLGVVTWGLGSALGPPKPRGSWRWQLLTAPPGGEKPIPGALGVSSPPFIPRGVSPIPQPPAAGSGRDSPGPFWGGGLVAFLAAPRNRDAAPCPVSRFRHVAVTRRPGLTLPWRGGHRWPLDGVAAGHGFTSPRGTRYGGELWPPFAASCPPSGRKSR